jgi:hypothetical protein
LDSLTLEQRNAVLAASIYRPDVNAFLVATDSMAPGTMVLVRGLTAAGTLGSEYDYFMVGGGPVLPSDVLWKGVADERHIDLDTREMNYHAQGCLYIANDSTLAYVLIDVFPSHPDSVFSAQGGYFKWRDGTTSRGFARLRSADDTLVSTCRRELE